MPAKQPTEESAFKNWINADLLRKIASSLKGVYPSFAVEKFLLIEEELRLLELKQRVRCVRKKLRDLLPEEYPVALQILLQSTRDGSLKGFGLWPYADFIEHYGLNHREVSLRALYELTEKFTGEFAVRPFIQKYPKETFRQLGVWATDKNHHVRRWVSEGTRPRLPWGLRLQTLVKDPSPTLPLLEKLKYDDELYVRKSVANHLNDISKDHPDLVVKLLKSWQKTAPSQHKPKIDWITRHALRGLLKAGHPTALQLLGYGVGAKVRVKNLKLKSKTVKVGGHLEFSFDIECAQGRGKLGHQLMVDYIIHHRKAGGRTSPKVFKLKTIKLAARDRHTIAKKHSFKPVTTRIYCPGRHTVEIQINGKVCARANFSLKI